MPATRIDVRRPRSDEEVAAVIDAVHLAQREALKIPEADRSIIYAEHSPARFQAPAGKSEDYTRVEISLFAGRSQAAKNALYAATVRRLGELGIAASDITVILQESPLGDWGLGGVAASELDLGFDVNV